MPSIHPTLGALLVALAALGAPVARAQTTPPLGQWTIIVHGRNSACAAPVTYDQLTAPVSGWMRLLADRIVSLAPGSVSVHKMDRATFGITTVVGSDPLSPSMHHVLMFDWTETASIDRDVLHGPPTWCYAGPGFTDDGYADAAGDALFAFLKAWGADDQVQAIIGHDRGAVVAGEAARRLILDGHAPRQVIYLDGEGCGAGLCDRYDDNDFDAWLPFETQSVRYDNLFTTFDESALSGGGQPLCNALYPTPLNLGGRGLVRAHNRDLGTAYAHGSGCLNAFSITRFLTDFLAMADDRYVWPDSPGSPTTAPEAEQRSPTDGLLITAPHHGDFAHGSLAGWLGAGGGGDADLITDEGAFALELDPAESRRSNFFFTPACATSVAFRAARTGGANLSDRLFIRAQVLGGAWIDLGQIAMGALTETLAQRTVPLPIAFAEHVARVEFELRPGSGFPGSGVLVDDVQIKPADPTFFTMHPGPKVAALDDIVSFHAAASGTNLTYQWRRNGAPLTDGGRISGATTTTLQITGVTTDDEGAYTCHASNICSTLASNAADLILLSGLVWRPVSNDTQPVSGARPCEDPLAGWPWSLGAPWRTFDLYLEGGAALAFNGWNAGGDGNPQVFIGVDGSMWNHSAGADIRSFPFEPGFPAIFFDTFTVFFGDDTAPGLAPFLVQPLINLSGAGGRLQFTALAEPGTGPLSLAADPLAPAGRSMRLLRATVNGSLGLTGRVQIGLANAGALVVELPIPSTPPPLPPCPGDADGDRIVDFTDLNIVLTEYGAAPDPCQLADFDRDGVVNFVDLNAALTAYGAVCPGADASSPPPLASRALRPSFTRIAAPAAPGARADCNQDGRIDRADLLALLALLGASGGSSTSGGSGELPGDLDADGDRDFLDLNALLGALRAGALRR